MVDPGLVSLAELGVLTVGVAIAVLEIRNMSQTRRAEVTLQFFDKFTQPEFNELWRHIAYEQRFDSIDEWGEKYGPTVNPDAYNKWISMMQLLNASGLILKKGLADLEDVHNYFAPIAIVTVWKKFRPLVEARRKTFSDADFWKSCEYLYNETKKKYPHLSTTSPYG